MHKIEVFGEVPLARFGHTITLVSKKKAVLFGGATGDTGKFSITGDTYVFELTSSKWTKLEGIPRMLTLHSFWDRALAARCALKHFGRLSSDGSVRWRHRR